MNELLQQFVIESRELAEAASSGLLALERSPRDEGQLNEVFRAFHTLKGGAAIVDFPAMESSMHAAESILDEARAGTSALTSAHIGHCLAALDEVTEWLDAIERSGELPRSADARPRSFEVPTRGSDYPTGDAPAGWLAQTLKRHAEAAAPAITAVRLVPAADSLYRGEDPLERMTSLPGLLALDLAAREPWAALESLDPFRCNLVLTALSSAPEEKVRAHLQGHTGECSIAPVAPGAEAVSTHPLPQPVTAVLRAQQALLGEQPAHGFAGRVGSAGAVAVNALRYCGREELSERIARAAEQSLRTLSAGPLQEALAQLLMEEPSPVFAPAAEPVAAPEAVARTFRIEAGQVDALVRLTGELTVVNNAIGHICKLARAGDPSVPDLLRERHGALESLIGELRRAVVRMRVRPLRA
ncbi:MAG TPA: Hpt domain-containing protein, partial [Steroidobacteraceae bacterium]|nr:Hpt domain-containing protein [Steroidobacteraceae bacterium]